VRRSGSRADGALRPADRSFWQTGRPGDRRRCARSRRGVAGGDRRGAARLSRPARSRQGCADPRLRRTGGAAVRQRPAEGLGSRAATASRATSRTQAGSRQAVDPNAPLPAVPAKPSLVQESLRVARGEARALIKSEAEKVVAGGRLALWAIPSLSCWSRRRSRSSIRARSMWASSKRSTRSARHGSAQTLDELQQPPNENVLGYQRHHVVEQNPDNVASSRPSRRSTSSSPGRRRSQQSRLGSDAEARAASPVNTIRWRTKTCPESSTGTSSTSFDSPASATRAWRRCACLECCNESGRLCEMTTDRLLPLFAGATKQLGFGRIFGGISAGSIPDLSLLAMDKEQRRQRQRGTAGDRRRLADEAGRPRRTVAVRRSRPRCPHGGGALRQRPRRRSG